MFMAEDPIWIASDHLVVVTMDQRKSRSRPDVVDATRKRLNVQFKKRLERTFVRTAGDEMQCATRELTWLVELVLAEARSQAWHIGIGVAASPEPLGRTARDSSGPAFWAARQAVGDARKRSWGFAIHGGPAWADVEHALALTAKIVRDRTERQHEAAALYFARGTNRQVAEALRITEQSASERLRGAGIDEESAGRDLTRRLMARAVPV